MEISQAVAAISNAADACAQVDLDAVTSSLLLEQLAAFRTNTSKLEAQFARMTHAADKAGATIGTGARDAADWVGKQTGTSTGKNRAAADLGEAMAKSADLSNAVASGRISSDKANAAIGVSDGLSVDAELIDEISNVPMASVRPTVEQWRARNDAAHEADRAARQRSQRTLRLTSVSGGMTRIDGLLDPDSASIVRTSLDAIMNQSAFDDTGRRRDQRCADALTQLCKASSKGKIHGGRSNAKVLAITPFETIVERSGAPAVTHAGPTIDADTIRQMACDAGIHRVITGPGSSILDFGRVNRLVSENPFLALVARDQHCRWPGCTIRATWCDAHHVTEWGHHGRTNETTCALLCHYHHSLTHQPGWKVTGNGHEFTIHHPNGTTETSRPPQPRNSSTTGPTTVTGRCDTGPEPPGDAHPPRAARSGREPSSSNAHKPIPAAELAPQPWISARTTPNGQLSLT